MELIVFVTLVGILASISLPGIVGWLPDYRLKGAAQDLHSNLQWTKLNAVRGNKDWAIVFDIATNRYFICSDSGSCPSGKRA
jgi:Tfp pilus assembly protein FimT